MRHKNNGALHCAELSQRAHKVALLKSRQVVKRTFSPMFWHAPLAKTCMGVLKGRTPINGEVADIEILARIIRQVYKWLINIYS